MKFEKNAFEIIEKSIFEAKWVTYLPNEYIIDFRYL